MFCAKNPIARIKASILSLLPGFRFWPKPNRIALYCLLLAIAGISIHHVLGVHPVNAQDQEKEPISRPYQSGTEEAGTKAKMGASTPGQPYERLAGTTPVSRMERQYTMRKINPTIPAPTYMPWRAVPAPVDPPSPAPIQPRQENESQQVPNAPNDMIVRSFDLTSIPASRKSTVSEPSVANMGNVVFVSGNWYAAVSADGGRSFIHVDPFTNFPRVNNGFCCDQIVNYAKGQNMLLWGLQYLDDDTSGTLRLARAIGGQNVLDNRWVYYDFDPQDMGYANGHWFDFPSMTLSSNYLYITSNVFTTGNQSRFAGVVAWRIKLAELAAGGRINYDFFRIPLTSTETVFTLRFTEGAQNTMYFAGWYATSSQFAMRIFRWVDDDTTIRWDTVTPAPFTYLSQDGVARAPDGTNWAGFADSRLMGGYVAGGEIGFMWMAKQDGSFPFPYVAVGQFRESDRSLIRQNPIWNPAFAFLYPNVAVNESGNLGGLIFYGGGGLYPNAAVWVSDDIQRGFQPVASYIATEGNSAPSRDRWGDYHTVRLHKDQAKSWVGATYYQKDGKEGANILPRYLWFGRERDMGQVCTYAISPTNSSIAAGGGTGTVSVTAPANCSWNASTSTSWISITAGTSGSGNGSVSYTVQPNTSSSTRQGTITIAGQTFTLSQAAATSCTYALSPTTQSFTASGGAGTISVTSGAGCNWTAVSNSTWIAINSGATGSGNGTVGFSVQANPGGAQRQGAIAIAGQSFAVLQAGGTPPARVMRVPSVSGSPGGQVGVGIELVSQGDENALSFSLSFNPSVLSNPQVALGADASNGTLNSNTNQAAQGRVGVVLALPSGQRFAAGTRRIVLVTFTIAANASAASTPIGFTNQPVPREISDTSANALDATYQDGAVAITQGIEADLIPRPNGNGSVTVTDWVQLGRFIAGTETVPPGSEFQRADCAPRDTLGNGLLSATDWVQASRYAAGLDPATPAGGPTAPNAANARDVMASLRNPMLPQRSLRLLAGGSQLDQALTIEVEMDAQGDESAIGFSLEFDPRALRFLSAMPDRGISTATLHVNALKKSEGKIGFLLTLPPGEALASGTRQLLTLTFAIREAGSDFFSRIAFRDFPILREIADLKARAVPCQFRDGEIELINNRKPQRK